MLNRLDHKGNANQNETEISPHSKQNGYRQEHKKEMLARTLGKEEPNPYGKLHEGSSKN
jgi:hypothetical protein